MTTPNSETIEQQLRDRIGELEAENRTLTDRIADIRRRAFPLPDAGQLSLTQYQSICSELTGTGLFTDVRGKLWPCWVRLPDDILVPDWVRRLHSENARRYLGK